MSLISNLQDDSIPLADDDPQVIIHDEPDLHNIPNGCSMDSFNSSIPDSHHNSMEEMNADDKEEEGATTEKARLISQVLELQNTLDDLSQRVDSVKEENLKLKSENQVLGQYIENLMSASSVFQSTSPSVKKK